MNPHMICEHYFFLEDVHHAIVEFGKEKRGLKKQKVHKAISPS